MIKLDFTKVLVSIVFLVICFPIFSVIHELAHVSICEFEGNEATFGYSLFGGWATCSGKLDNLFLYRVSGGFLAGVIAFGIGLTFRKYFRGFFSFIPVVFITIGIGEGTVMIMEGYFNEFYMTSPLASAISSMVLFITFISLIFLKAKKEEEIRN